MPAIDSNEEQFNTEHMSNEACSANKQTVVVGLGRLFGQVGRQLRVRERHRLRAVVVVADDNDGDERQEQQRNQADADRDEDAEQRARRVDDVRIVHRQEGRSRRCFRRGVGDRADDADLAVAAVRRADARAPVVPVGRHVISAVDDTRRRFGRITF